MFASREEWEKVRHLFVSSAALQPPEPHYLERQKIAIQFTEALAEADQIMRRENERIGPEGIPNPREAIKILLAARHDSMNSQQYNRLSRALSKALLGKYAREDYGIALPPGVWEAESRGDYGTAIRHIIHGILASRDRKLNEKAIRCVDEFAAVYDRRGREDLAEIFRQLARRAAREAFNPNRENDPDHQP